MKKLLLVAALACASAFAVTLDGEGLRLDARESALMPKCDEMGGCAIISRAELMQYVQALREQWMEEVRENFGAAVKQEAKRVCGNTI